MIAFIHGYLLEGSGSNLWTRSMIRALAQNGETVHLICQEGHPEIYDFIGEAHVYDRNGKQTTLFKRETPYPGNCIFHRPLIGDLLPVYVWDQYEDFEQVVPIVDLPGAAIEHYVNTNFQIIKQILSLYPVQAMHVNHAVLMSVVAQRICGQMSIPYVIMPHGSAIEYAVKKDKRFFRLAEEAFTHARYIIVIGKEMKQRVLDLFPEISRLSDKLHELPLGVDTELFRSTERSQRPEQISQLMERLKKLSRGRTAQQEERVLRGISDRTRGEELVAHIKAAQSYNGKKPDQGVESRLGRVNWAEEKILLSVGRLISSKGLPSLLAALPEILAREPHTRLIVAGHGPLREVLEIFVFALSRGYTRLMQEIVNAGEAFEGKPARPWEAVQFFWRSLQEGGKWESYLKKARDFLSPERVLFTGYLTHAELRFLFPCSDVAIFPSVVIEAGPLVFLESLASGCFPLGTYFGGMAISIDRVCQLLPPDIGALMKLRADARYTVADIASKVPLALKQTAPYREMLRSIAVRNYDWKEIARSYAEFLGRLR